MRSFKRLRVFAALVVITAGAAACGSSSDSNNSSTTSTTSASTPASGGTTSSGDLKSPGTHTIGVLPSTSTSENLAVWIQQVKSTMEPLGWKVSVCDGGGVVTKMEACMQSFVAQKVSGIVTMALGGPEIVQGFKAAKAAGIPVMAEGTTVSPGYAKYYTGGIYADDIVKMGAASADYIAENLKQPIVGEQITANYGGQGYINGLVEGLKGHGLKFADLRDTNLADIVNSMTTTAQAILQKNTGDVTMIDFSDFGASLIEPVLTRLGRNKSVTYITRYDDPTTVKLMKAGNNILVQVSQSWQHVFDMTDAMLANFNGGTAFPPNSKTVNEPGATVMSLSDFPDGSDEAFPFAPALQTQLATWGKTWKLSGA